MEPSKLILREFEDAFAGDANFQSESANTKAWALQAFTKGRTVARTIEAQEKKIAGFVEQAKAAEAHTQKLRRENLLYAANARGEFWAWQGDECDHLESLTCPVLIPAAELRALLEAAKTERG